MYKITFLIVFIIHFFIAITYSQVVITHEDMPNVKEIYSVKLKTDIMSSSFDYTETGADFTWDISDIDFSGERQDTFVSVSSTPLIFNIYFSNTQDTARKATIATARNFSIPVPGITIEDVCFFYKESTDRYSEVGFGAVINDIPMPIKYNKPDVLYYFPITYGSRDTSYSRFYFNLTDYGYFGESKRRINHVDGWGTLITEKGSFPVIRIKSDLAIEDTIYYEAYSQGIKFDRTETEYKWIAAQTGIPFLLVTERMNTTNMELFDTMFMNTAFIQDLSSSPFSFSIYPNPIKDFFTIGVDIKEHTQLEVLILDVLGHTVLKKHITNVPKGYFVDRINISHLNLSKGTYFIKLMYSETFAIKKIIVL